MTEFSNYTEFKSAQKELTPVRQRILGARFVSSAIGLIKDKHLDRLVNVAVNESASADELAMVSKTPRSVAVDSHTRCGAESDLYEQEQQYRKAELEYGILRDFLNA